MRKWMMICAFAALLLPSYSNAQEQVEIPGLIAYIGTDRNVYTVSPTLGESTAITNDAIVSSTQIQAYRWPTWSSDNRLAYFAESASEDSPFTTGVYVSPDGLLEGELVYRGEGEAFNYAYWSPGNCTDSPGCRALAILFSSAEAGGLFVELVKDGVDGTATSRSIGRGGPFYYSWSPNGQQMLWQRNNERLDIYDVATENVAQTLPQSPGLFNAPDWSPVDDRLLVGRLNDTTQMTDLVILGQEDTEKILVKDLMGFVAFAWSADGNYVAYVDRQGPLVVIDATTGEDIARSANSGVGAFFWSPDSTKIAYVTLATPPGSFSVNSGELASLARQGDVGLAWTVLNVESGQSARYGSFTPTADMAYLLTYFDQFSKSHRVWSPDSRHIVYSEITSENDPIVSLLDTESSNTVPFAVAEGTIGVWSFE